MKLLEVIANRLRYERMLVPLTQKELSELSGVSVNTIYRLEKGNQTTINTWEKICQALEIPPQDSLQSIGLGRLQHTEKVYWEQVNRKKGERYGHGNQEAIDKLVVGFASLYKGLSKSEARTKIAGTLSAFNRIDEDVDWREDDIDL